jgi:release factor glutamine methyltransferase
LNPTIHARVALARNGLERAGVSHAEAGLDARLLAQFVLGWDATRLLAHGNETPPPGFAARYEALVGRRARREPLAYITGEKEFWNLTFEVSPAVLIPRPETEILVEAALERFPEEDRPLSIADICTGSGCLAVALARERPRAEVTATDVSADALDVARRNAARHGVAGRLHFVGTDLLDGILGPFQLIVANPPYVPERDMATLAPEVRDHEPAVALRGGDDGLSIIRRLLGQAAERLAAGGSLIVEFGFGEDEAVRGLISRVASLRMIELRRDLQGIPRVAIVARE